ncbi:DUF418 domain-containing protein [Shewanella fidelis]|uniref:DUF418 domain-containing protein n=1 Tax=Shewanella fidelis TaxID=173509 RepID=UPI0004B67C03|nr:DUF418 domain-containing protein [Shewanella fidelis]
MESSTPTHSPQNGRNANLDAIRGIAVLGILFLNIYYFGNGYLGYTNHAVIPWYDNLIDIFNSFFLEARFLTLFSILFGVGLAIQIDKVIDENQANKVRSRLKWLTLFGLLHGIFIWFGDILFTYGLAGLVALCYIKQPLQPMLNKARLFLLIGFGSMFIIAALLNEPLLERGSVEALAHQQIWSGGYTEQLIEQFSLFLAIAISTPLSSMWYMAGLMLLGVYLYRTGVFELGFDRKPLLLLVVVALLLSTVDSIFTLAGSPLLQSLSPAIVLISALPTALVYIHFVVKICQNNSNILAPFQRVGRLAFSLYILQSIVMVLLFRYLAPTLVLSLDRPGYVAIAIAFSVLQLLLAHLYLRRFNQGPLEWLWRKLVDMSHKPTPAKSTGGAPY